MLVVTGALLITVTIAAMVDAGWAALDLDSVVAPGAGPWGFAAAGFLPLAVGVRRAFCARHRSVMLLLAVCAVAVIAAGDARADIIFYDDFAGTSLTPAWQVLPGQGAYSVDNGLQYDDQGPLSSPSGWSTTSLSLGLPFTGANWQIGVEATSSLDWCTGGTYTGPSVPNQSCSSGAQQTQVGVSFAPVAASDRSALQGDTYAFFDRGTDAWYGYNQLSASFGSSSVSGLLNPADSAINDNIAGGTYWYQFVRNGGTLTMSISSDGVKYVTALSETLANPSSSFNELVLTGETYLTAGSFTDYSSVNITTLSSAPEPSTWAMLGVGMMLMLLGRRGVGRFVSGRG